jgi:hypothetical protein
VAVGSDITDGATSRHDRHGVAEKVAVHDENTRRLRDAGELVRRQEHGGGDLGRQLGRDVRMVEGLVRRLPSYQAGVGELGRGQVAGTAVVAK